MVKGNKIALLAACAAGLLGATAAQALECAFRGMIVCEKMTVWPDILHVPFDLVVYSGNVQFARLIFNWNGRRIIGSELGTGSIDPDGKVQATANWSFRGENYPSDITGTLTATGGTLSGKQS